jgi:hypothetical protein
VEDEVAQIKAMMNAPRRVIKALNPHRHRPRPRKARCTSRLPLPSRARRRMTRSPPWPQTRSRSSRPMSPRPGRTMPRSVAPAA